MINSDQDSQFTCQEWIEYLESEQIRISIRLILWPIPNVKVL